MTTDFTDLNFSLNAIADELRLAQASLARLEKNMAADRQEQAPVKDITLKARTIICGDYHICVPEFSIATYNCCVDANGEAYASETEKPRVNISYYDAVKACEAASVRLMRGSQHLALVMDIMSVDSNWSGGKVGQGILKRGLHRGTVSGAQPGTYVSPHADEDRWFALPDGQRICDAAGHVFGWMFDDIHGGADGLTGKIPADSPYLVIANEFSRAQGMGYRPDGAPDWSGYALVRGGYWGGGDYAGVFSLGGTPPGRDYSHVGFRSTK